MTAPLLLVPGTLCDARVFAPLAAAIGGDVRSMPPIAHPTVGEEAEALLAIAPPRFVAGGFSLGAFIALELLRRAPERLAGVVLIASNPLALPAEQAAARRAEVTLARASGMAALIDGLWPRYVAERRRDDAGLRATVIAMAEAVGPDRFAAQAEVAISRPDSRDTVRDATVPVLILSGADDLICPAERWDGVEGRAITRRVLAGAGHFVPLEAPEAAGEIVAAWMGDLPACC